ncbi:MAG: type III secretion system cytoplasmic ring protein SctQ [Myxococcales bacterium]|nr:type III secretion system cytoplasmic ring protein SctQ [Myxococcales bacterium]MDD9967520.1 type III secretion system cytoplasmic ring protein SctQ [Myxococcales bacterium]
MRARPFPYATWQKVPKRDHDLGRRIRRLTQVGYPQAATIVAERLLGAAPRLSWDPPARATPRQDDQVGLCLAPATYDGGPVVVSGPAAVFQALADATLGGEWPAALTAAAATVDPLSKGALTYLAARCLAAMAGTFQVLGCVEGSELEELLGRACHIRWPTQLELGSVRARLALWIPESDLAIAPAVPASTAAAEAGTLAPELSYIPVALSARAGTTSIRVSDLRSLHPGDIVLLDDCWLAGVPEHLEGGCTLHLGGRSAASFDARFDARRQPRAITVVGRRPEEPDVTDGNQPTDHQSPRQPKVTDNVPIQLTLEMARFSIPLQTLSELQAGDVLGTRTDIGTAVTLRAGELPVARGELVDFEGEVGVRITEVLLTPEAAPSPNE